MTTSNIDTSQVKWRQVEHLQPGHWWLGEYPVDDESDTTVELWAQVSLRLDLVQLTTGRKVVRVFGTATDGEAVESVQYRGHQVQSLTQRQGAKAGLALPERAEEAP